MKSVELVELYQRTQDAARRLEAEAAKIHELAKRLETLTRDTPSWYAGMRQVYWSLCKPAIEKIREDWKAPELFTEFERLSRLMTELDRERGIEPPTQGQLREMLENEAGSGEESSTTTPE